MRRRPDNSMSTSKPLGSVENVDLSGDDKDVSSNDGSERPKRSAFVWLAMFVLILNSAWAVHHYQFESMPMPLNADQAGKRGFSEQEAMEHVKALTELGPHPVGSDALDLALQYVLAASEKIKKIAHWEVDVQVDVFHAESGANRLVSGLFTGKTLVYSDLKHIVLRILPKYISEEGENAILVSSHIDTVFSTEGAGDCSSCVAVMLELARGISQWAHGFKSAVIFLFNTGEEEGLNGAHSFITQHPWSDTVRLAIDLEAMGIGGKSSIFQGGPHPWAIENFAQVAKYPSGQIISQDLFTSGVIKSATDFQVYKEVAGLSGLDFAYSDNGAVYHTKNDKLKLLKPGSLQHLGENMLAFLLQTAASPHLPKGKGTETDKNTVQDQAIFFDILGTYMIVYNQRLANMLQNSVILQALLIWTTSLLMGGYPAAVSLGLSCLSVVFMWTFSLSFSVLVAFLLPLICSSPVPYIASPWLVVGLFAAPAVLGALTGQHLGYLILQKYLRRVSFKREKKQSLVIQADLIKLEAERWLFKAGIVQWLVILIVGNYYKIGSSYLALVWLVSPAFAYGLLEATLSPVRSPKPLKIVTLLLGLTLPVLISAGIFIRLAGTIIGIVVRFDRNPGSTPEWLGNVIVAVFIAVVICLTLVYLLSYVHLSGAKRSIVIATCTLFGLTLSAVFSGIFPPFTDETSRAVNVVHVVDNTGRCGEIQDPISYISLFSMTPGKLTNEVEHIREGFVCGKEKVLDFVTFKVNYGCWTSDDTGSGWTKSDIPTLHVERDSKGDSRMTQVSIETKLSTRWSLAINTEEIEDFEFEGNGEVLIPVGNKIGVDGWHIIQFSGGKNAPTRFNLTLYWVKASARLTHKLDRQRSDQRPLLKLRTDVDRLTPKAERVLMKLPPWCSLFGKSTSPYTLAFLTSLPVDF
ncbi:hypothetical protein HHK36_010844 [Tetracentron sinense]|uniref:Vacuolar membrane protease n=1 Tax=Tetracentron sinense TaxID=13715 RepID=A0A835DJX6_TETSI|nr:hypothetical protein HHK36_010844 [Tetracentron sinense]